MVTILFQWRAGTNRGWGSSRIPEPVDGAVLSRTMYCSLMRLMCFIMKSLSGCEPYNFTAGPTWKLWHLWCWYGPHAVGKWRHQDQKELYGQGRLHLRDCLVVFLYVGAVKELYNKKITLEHVFVKLCVSAHFWVHLGISMCHCLEQEQVLLNINIK